MDVGGVGQAIVTVLAVVGFAVVSVWLMRALLGVLRWAADAFLARETAMTRADRGDLTGMSDAERHAVGARRARWRALGRAVGWAVLLAAPAVVLDDPRYAYAVYAGLWLILRGVGRHAR